jgi:hypothetical protein
MSRKQNIQQRDVAEEGAARRLGLALPDFKTKLPSLFARGFPLPDPDTGLFDIVAIDRWCDSRHPHLFGGSIMQARDARSVVKDRIASM